MAILKVFSKKEVSKLLSIITESELVGLLGLVSFYSKAQPFWGSQTPQNGPWTRTAESNFESAIPSKPKIVFTKSELFGSE